MLPFSHFGLYLRSAWLSLAAFVAASLVITSILPLPPAPPKGNDLGQLIEYMTAPGGLLEVLAYEIVSLVLLVPAITIWIRLTVFGPPEDGRFPLLSLGGAEVRYLSAYVLIALMSLGAMIGVMIAAILAVRILSAIFGMLAGGVGTALMNLTSIAGFALGLAAFVYVTSRFMPALGATALGDAFDVKRGWAETKPQAWPLFWSLVSFAGDPDPGSACPDDRLRYGPAFGRLAAGRGDPGGDPGVGHSAGLRLYRPRLRLFPDLNDPGDGVQQRIDLVFRIVDMRRGADHCLDPRVQRVGPGQLHVRG